MADAFTQVYVHVVFIVQNRYCVISESWKDELYKYIAGIIRNNKHKLLAINGVRDHIHLFIGMKPSQSLSDLMQDIKRILPGGLMIKTLFQVNSIGNPAMVHFHILIHR